MRILLSLLALLFLTGTIVVLTKIDINATPWIFTGIYWLGCILVFGCIIFCIFYGEENDEGESLGYQIFARSLFFGGWIPMGILACIFQFASDLSPAVQDISMRSITAFSACIWLVFSIICCLSPFGEDI